MVEDVKILMDMAGGDKGPFALMACIFAAMWWTERKEVRMLTGKVIKLSAVVLAARRMEDK